MDFKREKKTTEKRETKGERNNEKKKWKKVEQKFKCRKSRRKKKLWTIAIKFFTLMWKFFRMYRHRKMLLMWKNFSAFTLRQLWQTGSRDHFTWKWKSNIMVWWRKRVLLLFFFNKKYNNYSGQQTNVNKETQTWILVNCSAWELWLLFSI